VRARRSSRHGGVTEQANHHEHGRNPETITALSPASPPPSLKPNAGGGIVVHNTSVADLERRVQADPFVEYNVVATQILELAPGRTDERLEFIVNG